MAGVGLDGDVAVVFLLMMRRVVGSPRPVPPRLVVK